MSSDPSITVEEDLKELLKRCPPGTYEAALAFRKNKDIDQVEPIVMGIIDRHLEPDQREILNKSDESLRMYEDLGMDSLTMLEIVMMVEQTLQVSIDNEELRDLRTMGDVKAYLEAKAKGEKPPVRAKTYRIEEIASLMPHREPFLFLESVQINGDEITGSYKISGNEYFLEGHFKENPVFPASIMIEALGQLAVFFLIKGDHSAISEKVDPSTIFFTSCDGVKCRRICKPGDLLSMKVKVSRIRHPLACFQGKLMWKVRKQPLPKKIKLAFDYFPVIDGQNSIGSEKSSVSNGNGSRGSSLKKIRNLLKTQGFRPNSSNTIRVISRSIKPKINFAKSGFLYATFPRPTETFVRRELRALWDIGCEPIPHSIWGGRAKWNGISVLLFPKYRLWYLFFWIPYWAFSRPFAFTATLKHLWDSECPSLQNFNETFLGFAFALIEAKKFQKEKVCPDTWSLGDDACNRCLCHS